MPVIRKEIGNHQFVVERANKNAFPKVGKPNTLYVDKESGIVYRFESPNYVGVRTGTNIPISSDEPEDKSSGGYWFKII